MTWPAKSVIYEINTWVWLNSLSQRLGKPITLATVPDEVLDELAAFKLDALWLMGVWTRSPLARQQAKAYLHEYQAALPDITPEDIVGSPYAVWDYNVDPQFGGRKALAAFRKRLRKRGLRLILDYVPNHVALDHPWVKEHPGYLIRGSQKDLQERPSDFFAAQDAWGRALVLAHGRDPYFPGWSDTAQVNAFSPEYRQAALKLLLDIARQCDGLRCDMAMLMVSRIFSWTWEDHFDPDTVPETEFWDDIIPAIKAELPDFLFMAEVYWDMEYEMQRMGFELTYDKKLYDRLIGGRPDEVRLHLIADSAYQRHLIRFIENHDEARAYTSLGPKKERPAATLAATVPGSLLLHDGQFSGRRAKLPVQIGREPDEPEDDKLAAFYKRLLGQLHAPIYEKGDWWLLDPLSAWSGNNSHKNLVAHGWVKGKEYRLVVVNLMAVQSQAVIKLDRWTNLSKHEWRLHDVLNGGEYTWSGKELTESGLYVDLAPYQSHIFHFEKR